MKNRIRLVLVSALVLIAGSSAAALQSASPIRSYTSLDQINGVISSFIVLPGVDTVGRETVYELRFQLDGDSLPSGASFELDFPPPFNLSGIDSIAYVDNDFAAADFEVESWEVEDHHLSVRLDSLDDLPDAGTEFRLRIYGFTNPVLAEVYQLLLTIVSAESQLVALPKFSSLFLIVNERLFSIEITPVGIQEARAGEAIQFEALTNDLYGNSVVVGPVLWSVLGLPEPAGVVEDGNFNAQHAGASRVIARFGTLADTSGIIYVLPGAFAYFTMHGGADSSVAGESWQDGSDDVTVTAYDTYGNVAYDFAGAVHFTATDAAAQLPFTAASEYTFAPADQGVKVFPGSGFKFFTAGRHSLSLIRGQEVEQSLFPISIVAAAPAVFNVNLTTIATAGQAFPIEITGAADAFDNSVSGVVNMTLASGNGASPSGVLPSLPAIGAVNGGAIGSAILTRSGTETMIFNLGGVVIQRDITVNAAAASRFQFDLDPVQAVNQPFFGTARLTAKDAYANVASAFSAQADTVTITADGAGQVFGNRLGSASAFVNGVCDLTDFGTGYNGAEPYVRFTSKSQSGITGQSPVVGMSLLKITDGEVVASPRYIGENFTVRLTVSNFGAASATVTALRLYGNGGRLNGLQIIPALSATIPGLSNQTFELTGPVPNLPNQTLTIDAVMQAQLTSGTVLDSVVAIDQLTILPTEGITVVAGSLQPTQVSAGREYQFSLRVRNDSDDELRLTTATTLTLPIPGASPVTTIPNGLVIIGAHSESEIVFAARLLPSSGPTAVDDASIRLLGNLGSANFDQTFPVSDEISIQTPPQIVYRLGTITPTTLYRGTDVEFDLGVANLGTATLAVDLTASELIVYSGVRRFPARIAAAALNLPSGEREFSLTPIAIPIDLTSIDSVVTMLTGQCNGFIETSRFKINGDVFSLPFGPAVRLENFAFAAPTIPNAPYLTTGQSFRLTAQIRNTGDEPLRDIRVRLETDGASSFDGDTTIGQLSFAGSTTIQFDIGAGSSVAVSELFTISIIDAAGATSGLAALVEPTIGSPNLAVVIQLPAILRLESQITSPITALDGIVGLGESLTIAASMLNLGQAQTSAGEITLTVIGGSFVNNGAATQSAFPGEQVNWTLTAPADDDTSLIEIRIVTVPAELNRQTPAAVSDLIDTLQLTAASSQVVIGVNFDTTDKLLLLPNNTYGIISFAFDIIGESESPYLNRFSFGIHSPTGDALPPASALSGAQLRLNGGAPINAVIDGNYWTFNLGSESGVPESAILSATVAPSPAVSAFAIVIDSNSFSASYQTGAGPKFVPVIPRFAATMLIERNFTIVESDLENSFFAYPNPFSPLQGSTSFVYSAASQNEATLTIYTLAGDEIFTRRLGAMSGALDPIKVEWDGRNNDGQVVRNGVYLAVLTVDGLGEVRTKVAVRK